MKKKISSISTQLEAIIENHKPSVKSSNFRKVCWGQYEESVQTYKWYIMAEIPPDYTSTHSVIFEYWTQKGGVIEPGFYIGDYHTSNINKAIIEFEQEVKKLVQKCDAN